MRLPVPIAMRNYLESVGAISDKPQPIPTPILAISSRTSPRKKGDSHKKASVWSAFVWVIAVGCILLLGRVVLADVPRPMHPRRGSGTSSATYSTNNGHAQRNSSRSFFHSWQRTMLTYDAAVMTLLVAYILLVVASKKKARFGLVSSLEDGEVFNLVAEHPAEQAQIEESQTVPEKDKESVPKAGVMSLVNDFPTTNQDLALTGLPFDDPCPLVRSEIFDLACWMTLTPGLRVPSGPWASVAGTRRGDGHMECQDAAVVLVYNDFIIAAVADGCGGRKRGREAARIAVAATIRNLVEKLASGNDPTLAVESSFNAASSRLQRARMAYGDPPSLTTLETTLIVAVSAANEVVLGHIGDGEAFIVRPSDNTMRRLLKPQRVDPDKNVLAACLGPRIHGEPGITSVSRLPGDIVMISTDGIADRIKMDFWKNDLVRYLVLFQDEAANAMNAILDELARHRLDDDLGLAVVLDGQPRFCSDFWSEPCKMSEG